MSIMKTCLHKWSFLYHPGTSIWKGSSSLFYRFYFDRNHDCFGNSNFASARCCMNGKYGQNTRTVAKLALFFICRSDNERITQFLLRQQIVCCSLLKSFTIIMPTTVFENLVFNYRQLECTEHIFRLRLKRFLKPTEQER